MIKWEAFAGSMALIGILAAWLSAQCRTAGQEEPRTLLLLFAIFAMVLSMLVAIAGLVK